MNISNVYIIRERDIEISQSETLVNSCDALERERERAHMCSQVYTHTIAREQHIVAYHAHSVINITTRVTQSTARLYIVKFKLHTTKVSVALGFGRLWRRLYNRGEVHSSPRAGWGGGRQIRRLKASTLWIYRRARGGGIVVNTHGALNQWGNIPNWNMKKVGTRAVELLLRLWRWVGG